MDASELTNISRSLFVSFLFVCLLCYCSSGEQAEQSLYVTARSGLSLRTQPGQTSERLLLIPYDARVDLLDSDSRPEATIDGRSSQWLRIRYGGYSGWAFGAYLSPIEPELRSRQARGQDCSIEEAKFAATYRMTIPVQPFISGAATRAPCIINDEPRILPEDEFIREVYVSRTGEWAIVLSRTDAFGDAFVINLRKNELHTRLRYSNFAIVDGDSAYIWVPLTCKEMQKKRFYNGEFTTVRIETQADDCHI